MIEHRSASPTACFALGLMALATPAFAGDTAQREVLGFSRDERTFGFVQFGTEDASGASWCELLTVDVTTNRWASPPSLVRLESPGASPERACEEVRRKNARTLRALGLDRPVRGLHVIHHPLHDVGVPGDTVTFSVHRCSFCSQSPHHTVTAAGRRLVGGGCQDSEPPAELLTVTVDGVELQRDLELPQSRGCASWYRIVDVFLTPLEDRLVTLIAFKRQGFEGADVRFLAVSGAVPAPVPVRPDGGLAH